MIDLVSDLKGLERHLKGSKLQFREGVIDYYAGVGESQGLTVARSPSVIRNTVNYGKVDLIWVEPNVVFCCEFGLLDDVYRHIFKLMQLKPSMSVLILSSNAQCKPDKVKEIVLKTPELAGLRENLVILDVSKGVRILP